MFYINDDDQIVEGIIHGIDITFLCSGKAVDIDYIVHQLSDNVERDTAEFFSDFEINKKIFKSRRKARKVTRK